MSSAEKLPSISPMNGEYKEWLKEIKNKIASVRVKIATEANGELIKLYYEIGEQITHKEKDAKWGSSFVERFSSDLKKDFPGISGFSAKNLRYCRAFYNFYSGSPIWQQAVAKLDGEIFQIPWGHNIMIFTKTENVEEALFYARQTISNGWSRDILAMQLKSKLHERAGKSATNFVRTLPLPQSGLAQQTLKDPYTFDFMEMTAPYNERDVERQLVAHITQFLLELGKGFAFIGHQYHIEVGGTDYFIDMLFYHTVLKCYVVVELKNKKFVPEYAGKLNFYLSAVDSLIKQESDNPTIGLLLCRDKNNIEVEFALRDIQKPMGVSEYILTEILPDNLKGSLPTVEEIESIANEAQDR